MADDADRRRNPHRLCRSLGTSSKIQQWMFMATWAVQRYGGADSLKDSTTGTFYSPMLREFDYYYCWRSIYSKLTPTSWLSLEAAIPEEHQRLLGRLVQRSGAMASPQDTSWRGCTFPAPRVAVLQVDNRNCCSKTVAVQRDTAELEAELAYARGYGADGARLDEGLLSFSSLMLVLHG
jgi:hypothetical protein